MNKITKNELANLLQKRNDKANEILDNFANENQQNNPMKYTRHVALSLKEANDIFILELLQKLDVLED